MIDLDIVAGGGGSAQVLPTRVLKRAATAAEWTAANPVLLLGEEGYESDTGRSKVGDGETQWTGLDYEDNAALDLAAADATAKAAAAAQQAMDHADTAVSTAIAGEVARSDGVLAAKVATSFSKRVTDWDPRDFLVTGDSWDESGGDPVGYAIQGALDQAAATYAAAGDPGLVSRVRLGRGTFALGSAALSQDMGTEISGEGMDFTTLLAASTDGQPGVQFTTNLSANGIPPGLVVHRDFTLDGRFQTLDHYATEPKGISGSGAKRVRSYHVRVKNTLATGMAYDHATDLVMIGPEAWNCGRNIRLLGLDPRTVSGHSGIGIGVGRDYAADRTVTDAAISNGSRMLSSASAAFTAADVGTTVVINGAATGGKPLVTTISSLTSATVVQVADPATATVSAATMRIVGGRPFIDTDDAWANGLQQHLILGFVAVGNGRAGLFYERTVLTNPYTKGVKASGIAAYNNFGVFDNGTWGADYDIKAIYNRINGVRLDSTILSPRAGAAGRVRGEIALNGTPGVADSANVWIGTQTVGATTPDGYEFDAHIHDAVGGPNVGSSSTSVWARGMTFRGKADKAAGSGVVVAGTGTGPSGEIEDLTLDMDIDRNGTDATQTYRDGVTVLAATSRLSIRRAVRSNAGYGIRAVGYEKTLDRATITADLDGNALGASLLQHSISADSVVAPVRGDTSDPSALRTTFVATTSVGLSWTAPNPATGVTGYSVRYRTKDVGSGAGSWTAVSTGSTATTHIVTGLTTNTVYEFAVAKITGAGTGTYTAGPVAAKPATVPDPYADNFTTSGTLSGATAPDGTDTSKTWSILNLGANTGAAFTKTGGKVQATAGSGGGIAVIDTGAVNGSVQVTVVDLDAAAFVGLVARASDANNHISARIRTVSGTPKWRVYRTNSVTETLISTDGSMPTAAAGDVARLAFNGATIYLYINGSLVFTSSGLTDSQANNAAGHTKHGLIANFAVDTSSTLDAWSYNPNPV